MSYDVDDYKVNSLIAEDFEGLPIYTIDFKRHLKPSIALNKTVEKSMDGRPIKSNYYYNGDLIAVIYFEFLTTPENLVYRRSEKLKYILNNNQEGLEISIKEKTYDLTNPADGENVIKERVDARESIISNIKYFLIGIMQANTQQNLSEIIEVIKPFWEEYETERKDFIELGDNSWVEALSLIDLATTPHVWLNYVVNDEGTTVLSYIIWRLSYNA